MLFSTPAFYIPQIATSHHPHTHTHHQRLQRRWHGDRVQLTLRSRGSFLTRGAVNFAKISTLRAVVELSSIPKDSRIHSERLFRKTPTHASIPKDCSERPPERPTRDHPFRDRRIHSERLFRKTPTHASIPKDCSERLPERLQPTHPLRKTHASIPKDCSERPKDQKTERPKDQKTKRPKDQKTERPKDRKTHVQ